MHVEKQRIYKLLSPFILTAMAFYMFSDRETSPPVENTVDLPAPCEPIEILTDSYEQHLDDIQPLINGKEGREYLPYKAERVKIPDWSLTYEEAVELYECIHAWRMTIDQEGVEPTPEVLNQLAREIAPYFEYEGFVNRTNWPKDFTVDYYWYLSGKKHNHVLGTSNCRDYVRLNARFSNEFSTWYGSKRILAVTTHELAHMAQGSACDVFRYAENTENTAQLMMFEVLSSLAIQGNRYAITAILLEFENLARNSLSAAAIREDRLDELKEYITDTPQEEMRFDKTIRRWEEDPQTVLSVIDRYDIQPLRRAFIAHYENIGMSDLQLPQVQVYIGGSMYRYEMQAPVIYLDDFFYILMNFNAFCEAYAE